ncbi:MAG: hypothetical protein ACRETW_14800 [Stenotrophobium sp.]
MADYLPLSPIGGNLVGLCPVCNALMYRRVSYPRLREIQGNLEVRLPVARQRIDESSNPSVNHDFKQE